MVDRFEGCTATECVRLKTGKKTFSNYQIEETCRWANLGLCTYKRHVKIERTSDERELEPAVGVD